MLSYAFADLNHPVYTRMRGETFENIDDLLATILMNGLRKQVKQGLFKDYKSYSEDLAMLRGKVVPRKTFENQIQRKQLLHVEFDEMTEDNLYNQILKTTALLLIRNDKVTVKTKQQLKKILLYFGEVSTVDLSNIAWSDFLFHRHNKSYELLINICYFICRNLLMTQESGAYQLPDYDEESLARLFEKFVLNYYKKHHPELKPKANQISWAVSEPLLASNLLPIMKTDIVLNGEECELIIDTKFYKRMYQYNYQTRKHYSNNLYQIFTYVQNRQVIQNKKVSGLLLYAQTHNEEQMEAAYKLAGNEISIQSIDLNQDFKEIRNILEKIAWKV